MLEKNRIFLNLKKFKNRIAIIDANKKKYLYKQLIEDTHFFKKFFKKKKIIIILADNSYEFIAFYVSAILNNQTIILADAKINIKDLDILISNYQPNLIYSDLSKKIENFNKVFSFKNFCLFENKLKKKHKIEKSLNLLIPTSGTTGQNKYVKLSSENIYDNTLKICEILKIKSKDITITTMPPIYSYALSIINTHLQNGASIILNKFSLIDSKFWSLIKDCKPTNFNGVPYIYEILIKIGLDRLNFKSLRFLTQAGGSLNEEMKKKIFSVCKKTNTDFYIMYGQAEASPRISILPSNLFEKNYLSVGLPLKGGKITLGNRKYNKEKKLYEGEIIYKGKNVFMGYSKNFRDLGKKTKKNRSLKTGDIGYIKKKLIYLTGRKKRIIKIFGIRISLDQLEQQLNDSNFCCVCKGNDKKLIVEIEKYHNVNIVEFSKKIQKKTRLNSKFYEINIVDKFKRNKYGKILYK